MNGVLDICVHHIHIRPMTTLGTYMANADLTDAALAGMVGCDRSMITKIRHGKAVPSLPLALSIQRITGVPVESFVCDHPVHAEAGE